MFHLQQNASLANYLRFPCGLVSRYSNGSLIHCPYERRDRKSSVDLSIAIYIYQSSESRDRQGVQKMRWIICDKYQWSIHIWLLPFCCMSYLFWSSNKDFCTVHYNWRGKGRFFSIVCRIFVYWCISPFKTLTTGQPWSNALSPYVLFTFGIHRWQKAFLHSLQMVYFLRIWPHLR